MSTNKVLTSITDEHLIPLEILCSNLHTTLDRGLDEITATNILKQNGKNKLKFPYRRRTLDRRLSNTFRIENDDENFTKAEWERLFNSCFPNEVLVLRNGIKRKINTKYIVTGDIVYLAENQKVPADIRLIECSNMSVYNKLITGNRCENRSHLNHESHQDCLLSANMLFACTKILSGSGIGIVLRTGDDTVFGSLKNFATRVKYPRNIKTILRTSDGFDRRGSDSSQESTIYKRPQNSNW